MLTPTLIKKILNAVIIANLTAFASYTLAQAPYEEGNAGDGPTVEETITEWVEEEGTQEQQQQWNDIQTYGANDYIQATEQLTPGGVIWRGFHHYWTYNHRLNRLADYTQSAENCDTSTTSLSSSEQASCSATITHGAASGSGDDTAYYNSFHSFIGSDEVYFKEGSKTFYLDGKEGIAMLPLPKTVSIGTDTFSDAGTNLNYEVLLAGFDIVAPEEADKLEHLRVSVGDVIKSGTNIEFDITVELQVDCDSLECDGTIFFWNKLNQKVNYEIEVHYVVVAADANRFASTARNFSYATYEWSAPSPLCLSNCTGELDLADKTYAESITGAGNGQYATAALGFKEIKVTLDKEHHMVEFDTAIQPGSYNAATGTHHFDVELMFKAWNENVAQIIDSQPSADDLSFSSSGHATFFARIAMLEFANSCVFHSSKNGAIVWDANGGGGASDAALSTKTVDFWYDGNNCGLTVNLPTEKDCNQFAQETYDKCMASGGSHSECLLRKENIEAQCSQNFNAVTGGQIFLNDNLMDLNTLDNQTTTSIKGLN